MALGPVLLDLVGLELLPEERELLQHPLVGGVILFQRNYASPDQLHLLVASIRALRQPPLLISVDHEGGRVQRFREGFSRLPPVAALGQQYSSNPQQATHRARQAGWLMAIELRAMAVDFSFAPVLDLDFGICEVIGTRAFHQKPEVVVALAGAYIKGMREAGMAATGKHFPGHGGVSEDSHLALPVDHRPLQVLEAEDMRPFQQLASMGMAAVMPAHVVYSQVDSEPAGFSFFWLTEILRRRLAFSGVIYSDDLNMAAAGVGGDFPSRAYKAMQAGCDMVLVCNNRKGAEAVLDGLHYSVSISSSQRLARMYGEGMVSWQDLHADLRWVQAVKDLSGVL